MDFAFSFNFKPIGYAYSGTPLKREAIRIERMVKQLTEYAEIKKIEGSIYVSFNNWDSPVIEYKKPFPKGLEDDVAALIYNSSTL